MKNHLLIKTMLLLCALVVGSSHSVWAQVASGTTLWSETWTGATTAGSASDKATPSANYGKGTYVYHSGTVTYNQSANSVYVRNDGTGGGTAPELMLTSGQTWTISDIPTGGASELILTYKSNNTNSSVTCTTEGTTVSGSSKFYSINTGGAATITLAFTCSNNTRIDDVYLKVADAWESTSTGVDNLTYTTLGFESGGSAAYTEFSNIKCNSSARYAGKAYKMSKATYIQIKSANSDTGIITTTSGGKARKVVVTWNSSNGADGNTIDIYGKSTAYSAASELYGTGEAAAAKGTKLGSIARGTSTELIIAENYPFIGIRSSDGICYLDNITIYWEGDAVSLSDASNYTPVAKDYAKVTLDRSFVAGWNGIVLPFDLTTSVKTALGATEVKTLGSATESAGAISLGFTDAELPVAAGTPVLVKLNNAIASGDAVINGIEIKTTAPTTVEKTVAGNTFTLAGGYSTTDLGASEAYFVSNTKFYHKKAGDALSAKPFRAYITQTAAATSRMNVNFDLEGGETTGIIELQREGAANTRYYNLCGQQVTQPNKGLYIANGRKVIIK